MGARHMIFVTFFKDSMCKLYPYKKEYLLYTLHIFGSKNYNLLQEKPNLVFILYSVLY